MRTVRSRLTESACAPPPPDLVRRMLCTDPSLRCPLPAVLAHPWVTTAAPTRPLLLTQRSLHQYVAERKFRAGGHVLRFAAKLRGKALHARRSLPTPPPQSTPAPACDCAGAGCGQCTQMPGTTPALRLLLSDSAVDFGTAAMAVAPHKQPPAEEPLRQRQRAGLAVSSP